jgi:hypothetical protein
MDPLAAEKMDACMLRDRCSCSESRQEAEEVAPAHMKMAASLLEMRRGVGRVLQRDQSMTDTRGDLPSMSARMAARNDSLAMSETHLWPPKGNGTTWRSV